MKTAAAVAHAQTAAAVVVVAVGKSNSVKGVVLSQ